MPDDMREVFLVRHGEAEAAARSGADPDRALTERGRETITNVGRALATFGVRVDAVWHSGFVRADETAAIIARALGVTAVRVEAAFSPVGSSERAAAALRETSGAVLCVSHMPLLPALVEELCGARVDFGTGTVAHVIVGSGHAALVGLWSADKLACVR